jgi:polar amino acid transport system substrate-binding protein
MLACADLRPHRSPFARRLRRASLALLAVGLPFVAPALAPAIAQAPPPEAAAFPVPLFRHVDPLAPAPDTKRLGPVRFLADADFPPFSYQDQQGTLTGFNVELAQAICAELRLACEFIVRPWEDIEAALLRREGDAILSGVRVSRDALQRLDFTRPHLRTLGRFAVAAKNEALATDPRSLAGKRIGVVAGTTHEAFLKEHFARSSIQPYDSDAAAREALKAGAIDALFGDGFQLIFWLASGGSENCCRLAKGAYAQPDIVSTPIAIALRRDDFELRYALDYGLDRLQTDGTFAALYRRFFPMSVW